jgi:mannose-6-phosphate isomerase-like protein (cupin superfamily)
MTLENMGQRKQTEVTPGNVFDLGLPFVLQNQSLFNYWDIDSGNYFLELEGQHYGWDSATVQVSETGPGIGPPLHTHSVEEIFLLLEGEVAFTLAGNVLDMKGPALVRVPPNTSHNVTTLGTGRNKLITFFSSNNPGAAPVDDLDPFALIKAANTAERTAMIANFRKVLADFDADGDGKLSRDEAPILIRAQFDRYDTDHDGFITMEDAQQWD